MRAGRAMRAAVTIAAALAVVLEARAQQFRLGIHLVRLPVVVAARDGAMVRGLKATDFEVLEDDVKQTIVAFAEGATGDELPLHLGLMLDGSISMEHDLKDAGNAAITFVQALEEATDVTLLDFDTSIRIGRFTRSNYFSLFERIRGRKAKGGTALYDSIGIYLEGAVQRGGQHVLLVYTDGGDSRSQMHYGQLEEMLRFANVVVYAIGYLENQVTSVRSFQQSQLMMMARETGGEAFFPSSARDLDRIYSRILDEIGARYTLGYESSNSTADGKFRKVQVRVTSQGVADVKVRTRSGYLAPLKRTAR
jgi:Ca-activated chloride channel family protein